MVRKHWLTIVVVVFLFVSIGVNVSYMSKQNDRKIDFLTRVYGGLQNITTLLDPATEYENVDSKMRAEAELRRLCDTIFYYHIYVDENLYWNKMNFDHLAFTLSSQSGDLDGMHISGILEDGIISTSEKSYLNALYNDVSSLIIDMKDKNSNQVDLSTSIGQINRCFDAFFSKWNTRSTDTPFKMLMSK